MNNRDIIPLTPTHGNNTTAAAAPVGAPPLPTTTTTTAATTIGTTTSSSFKWTEEALIALAEEVGNCRAHVPPHGQTEKLWKDVQASLNRTIFAYPHSTHVRIGHMTLLNASAAAGKLFPLKMLTIT